MATAFPTGLDSFLNPAGSDKLNNAVNLRKHSIQHGNVNDAVAAIEAKVGIDGSAVTSSFDYRIDALENAPSGNDGAGGVWPPEGNGFKAWSLDPTTISPAATVTVTGLLYVTAIWLPTAQTITNVHVLMSNVGTVTGAYGALYSAAGALLSQSANGSAAYSSAGLKTHALAVPQAVAAGKYYVGWWLVTSSAPGHNKGTNSDDLINVNTTLTTARSSTANSGLVATAPASIGTRTNRADLQWVAVS